MSTCSSNVTSSVCYSRGIPCSHVLQQEGPTYILVYYSRGVLYSCILQQGVYYILVNHSRGVLYSYILQQGCTIFLYTTAGVYYILVYCSRGVLCSCILQQGCTIFCKSQQGCPIFYNITNIIAFKRGHLSLRNINYNIISLLRLHVGTHYIFIYV